MDFKIAELAASFGRYLLSIQLTGYLDLIIMIFILYRVLLLVRTTRASSLMKGLLIFLAALMLSTVLNLHGINYILSRLMDWGVLALIILFQPEIRRILEQMGSRRITAFFAPEVTVDVMEQVISQTVLACSEMSQSRTGALIVFEREILLDELVRSGTVLDAAVSGELLKNIFFVKAPLHDGAVIIRNGRILGAGCVLPLSRNVNLSRDLGTRHRAGIGMSENSDAVIAIVSEETGTISVATGGMLKRHLKAETLENLLRNELLPQQPDNVKSGGLPLLERLRGGVRKLSGTVKRRPEEDQAKTGTAKGMQSRTDTGATRPGNVPAGENKIPSGKNGREGGANRE